ncbi:MAG: hypothetical protein HZB46_05050 [Solirubrobacterales bacterium]|nr:hypothetical protein [Solirubrobacterales bacterium]
MRNVRLLFALAALVALAAIGGAVAALAGGGGDDDGVVRAKLQLERYRYPGTGQLELIVSLLDAKLNVPESNEGSTRVTLTCWDAEGAVLIKRLHEFPLLEEEGVPLPHLHEPMSTPRLNAIARCTIEGPGLDFESRA